MTLENLEIAPPPTASARALVAYLVMKPTVDSGRERLAEMFWPNTSLENARNSFKTALWSIRNGIRKAGLDPDRYIFANRSLIRWLEPIPCDYARFMELALSLDAADRRTALEFYAGDFFEGDAGDWVAQERVRAAEAYEYVLRDIVATSDEAHFTELLLTVNPSYPTATIAPAVTVPEPGHALEIATGEHVMVEALTPGDP